MPNMISCARIIKLLHDRLERQANNDLRDKDLTLMQIAVLIELENFPEKEMTMKELEKKFSVAQSTMAGIISRLEQKGFVESYGDATDKRIKVVHITKEGEECSNEAEGYMEKAEETLLRGFSDDEKKIFHQLLFRAAENVK